MSRSAAGRWAEGAGVCLSMAVIAFALGSFSGFNSRPTRPCLAAQTEQFGRQARTPDADIEITSRQFPMSMVCTFPDGTRVELVPGWINPLLIGSLIGAAGCVVGAVRAGAPSRKRT